MNAAEHEHRGSGGQLRWHPFLRQWVAVAAYRQNRPQMPKDWCPFDPGSGRVPDDYDVYLYPNDFPAFSEDAEPFSPETGLYATTGARGACDVVLYSPDHNKLPSQLTVEQWRKVADLWTNRTRELFGKPDVRYVCIFENTGEAIGVTMSHPHGQIYAFPFVPPLVEQEFESARDHFEGSHECLYCKVLAEELRLQTRLVAVNGSFASFVPYYGRFPSEIHIYARRHAANLMDLSEREQTDLASMLNVVRQKYDNLYGFAKEHKPLPLMMLLRQGPAKESAPWFHFHIVFLPIQRSATKLKYLASVESGCGTYLNDTRPEEQAAILRQTEPEETL